MLRYHSDMLYPTIPCVGCGYCCRKVPCLYSPSDKAPCPELVEVDGIWRCGKFLRLKGEAKQVFTEELGIGAGCCSPLNTDRRKHLECPHCRGSGRIRAHEDRAYEDGGPVTTEFTCSFCRGTGRQA